ncbi:hypothetical protein GE300_21755 [Rhodobacteraceae bacterium 2CG4]|uniref:Lipoprotein n=1 Tax=Halovulum marinum TaxID=2662447 RepID=A0A6L5Z6I3_9RHOB|nr:hypothetical protein [Halovulum marinum]MSU92163.1 hypothetical protein [Halovulum marinum]
MRQIFRTLPVLLTVAACATPPVLQAPSQQPPVATTPFTYKANTPLVTRAYDINECELSGRGLPPNATQAEIADATAGTDPAQVASFVQRCLSNKGYTVTELPVCRQADFSRGTLVVRPNVQPPLDSIICLDPSQGGMLTTQPPASA